LANKPLATWGEFVSFLASLWWRVSRAGLPMCLQIGWVIILIELFHISF